MSFPRPSCPSVMPCPSPSPLTRHARPGWWRGGMNAGTAPPRPCLSSAPVQIKGQAVRSGYLERLHAHAFGFSRPKITSVTRPSHGWPATPCAGRNRRERCDVARNQPCTPFHTPPPSDLPPPPPVFPSKPLTFPSPTSIIQLD